MDANGLRAVLALTRKPRSGAGKLIAAGVGLAVVGACWLWANSDAAGECNGACQQETCYYQLPSLEARDAIEKQAAQQLAECDGDDDHDVPGLCVCCHERSPTLMFVGCGHLCVCEACLIKLAEVHELVVRRRRFAGPVKLPCPMCRKDGFLIKAYMP